MTFWGGEIIKKLNLNHSVSIALLLLYIVTFIINYYTVRSISFFSLGMCVVPHVAFWIFLHKFKPMYYIGIVLFSCFGLYFGRMLDWYNFIPIYDLLLHFSSGILLVFLGHYIYSWLIRKDEKTVIPLKITVIFCILFSISCAAFWEIWEFSGDTLFGLTAQGSQISDTMTDIIAGTIGAAIGGFILSRLLKHGKIK